jgi:transposase
MLHRIRSRLIQERTALINQMRGLLLEYGAVIPQGISQIRKNFIDVLNSHASHFSHRGKLLLADLYEQLKALDVKISYYDKSVQQICRESEVCQRLIQVQGGGPLTATAFVAAVGTAKILKVVGRWPLGLASFLDNALVGVSKFFLALVNEGTAI